MVLTAILIDGGLPDPRVGPFAIGQAACGEAPIADPRGLCGWLKWRGSREHICGIEPKSHNPLKRGSLNREDLRWKS